ncbi:MAG: NADH-quinone oxidoreductase subunit L [Chloroflexi bacterium]|nr:NADH-quinone oxidoreductase subunit L [Chloroflexota bacterium]
MPEPAVWAIILLPLGSLALIAFVIRPFFNRAARLSGYITILALLGSLALSGWALKSALGHEGPIGFTLHPWLTLGGPTSATGFTFRVGLLLDPLSAIMLVVVSGVSLMVQVYSQGYMRGDPGYSRYFAFMSLFTASMLGLVLARNLIMLYVFWELVGLCSYLLIGFWYHRPAAAAAAKKAFIVTRLGDFGFLLALLYLYFHRASFVAAGLDPFDIADLHRAVATGAIGGMVVTWLAVGVFAGAAGKSAQFPLHVWLPDAMEGPTPVSSLIHAATMVAAGVFLVARLYPVFVASQMAMNVVAVIGGFTALFAATMGLVMNDIKRVMAYSTVSQLGYMMLALGVGAPVAAIFHLFNHAFFKCLLFLGAGSVNHATGTFNMQFMGGLRRVQPWTYATVLVAGLSLAGIFPLSGFWSKDEVLVAAWRGGTAFSQVVFWLAMAAVFLTAFYAFRMMFLTFHGQFRGGVEAEQGGHASGEHRVHLAESPAVMVFPMVVLGIAAVVSGFLANPVVDLGPIPKHWFAEFLGGALGETHPQKTSLGVAVVSMLVALGGIGLAWAMYGTRVLSPQRVGRALRPLHTLLTQRYYMDHLYERAIVSRGFYKGACQALEKFDDNFVDRAVNMVGWFSRNTGHSVRRLQTGQVQLYGVGIVLGIIVILAVYLIGQ